MVFSLLFQIPAAGSALAQMLPLLLLFGVFYVLIFMPMQRQRKKTKQMLENLQNGNVVLTTGGIVGTIVSIDADDTVILQVKPSGVKLQFARSAISSVVSGDAKK